MINFNAILGIGIALILIPLLGFPVWWKNFFIIVSGLWLCELVVSARFGRSQRKRVARKNEPSSSAVPFVENQSNVGSSENASSSHNHEQTPQS